MRRRAPQLADDVVEIAGLRIDPAAHVVSAGDKPIDLWTTELRLLHFFMTHPGRVFSRARLLDEVWGEHVFVEERTVDVHIRRLRQALDADRARQADRDRARDGLSLQAGPEHREPRRVVTRPSPTSRGCAACRRRCPRRSAA